MVFCDLNEIRVHDLCFFHAPYDRRCTFKSFCSQFEDGKDPIQLFKESSHILFIRCLIQLNQKVTYILFFSDFVFVSFIYLYSRTVFKNTQGYRR